MDDNVYVEVKQEVYTDNDEQDEYADVFGEKHTGNRATTETFNFSTKYAPEVPMTTVGKKENIRLCDIQTLRSDKANIPGQVIIRNSLPTTSPNMALPIVTLGKTTPDQGIIINSFPTTNTKPQIVNVGKSFPNQDMVSNCLPSQGVSLGPPKCNSDNKISVDISNKLPSDIMTKAGNTVSADVSTAKLMPLYFPLGIKCEHCELIFKNQMYFDSHVMDGKCQWICKFCKRVFPFKNTSLFIDRLKKHKEECDSRCRQCGNTYTQPFYLRRHVILSHSKKDDHVCKVCFETFNSEDILHLHGVRKHGNGESILCPKCSKQLASLESLCVHLKQVHNSKYIRDRLCSICGKIFTRKGLKEHEKIHMDKHLKCDKCPATFRLQKTLETHKKTHTEDYRNYCGTCGKGFNKSSSLTEHRRTHTGEKPFSCSVCQYSCRVKANLKKHMKVHNKSQ